MCLTRRSSRVRAAGILTGAAFLAVPLAAQQQLPDVRLSYLCADTNLPAVAAAWKDLLAEHPDLRGRVELTLLTESLFDEVDPRSFVDADALVLSVHDQHTIERFDATHGIDLIGQAVRRGTVFGVGEGLLGRDHYEPLGVTWDRRARAYWEYSGFANQLGLLEYVLSAAGVDGLAPGEPQPNLEAGYYYPGEPRGRVFATWREFDDWRARAGGKRPGAPRIAVGFYGADFDSGNTGLVDAVVAEIERQGAEAVPVFGYPAGQAFEALLLDDSGEARVDVAMAFLFRFAGPDAGSSLAKLDVPVLSLISLYGRGEQEWRESEMGLSLFEGTFQVVSPELAGLVAPTVVGSQERIADPDTGLTIVARRPIPSRVAMAVRRALRYAALAATPNAGKRLALLYYNYPPGKADIGASYLNVAESLANVLERLREEGYDVGDLGGGEIDLSADALLEKMLDGARNVGSYAPGELDRMLDGGDAVRIGMDLYRRWLDALAPELRAKMVADWGPPEAAEVMAAGPRIRGVERELVVPVIRFGNVALLPQPARGWGEDLTRLYHADDLAPHHQYAAAYLWLREPEDGGGFGADAVVHVGTHGTLEWLDGKAMGLSAADAPDALLGDLPDLYIYNVDVVGEGLVARRRGMATVVDHMAPPFVQSRLLPELAALGEVVDDYHQNVHKNETLAEAYADQIRERSEALGILKDLQLELGDSGVIEHEALHEIEDYMTDLRSEHIPYGLHAFGRLPEPEMRRSTVEAVVAVDRSLLPDAASVLAEDMEQRIVESAPRELANLVRGLGGLYVPSGGGGEPIRKPDAYPTGKNLHGIDPDKVPKPAAWDLGVKLADEMLASHVEEHGRYPEKVSFVIWGAETLRHEGVIESQVFHLLGTRPVWNVRGDVVDVEVIPSRRLGRPRVDIVISSAAEGMFNNVTRLIDQAVQRVKALDEAENYVRRHYLATRAALVERGYGEEEAVRRAGVRIFDEPPGRFNLNTSRIAAASGSWDSDVALADEYISKMGHGYGNGFWGEPMEDVFRLTLSGVEKVVHSSSTSLYGALDNDDFFMYAGGLAAAVRSIDGESPELVVTNTRDPGSPEMTGIDRFLGAEFRSRYVNPTWIEGMQKEGYAGAGEMRAFVEYLWGWDAVVTETVDDRMWRESFEVYVEDRHELGMREFFEANSPFAYQDITGRMVETIRKGYWEAREETLRRLLTEYAGSVAEHGAACSGHTCANPRLLRYVIEQGAVLNVPAPLLQAFRAAMESAIAMDIERAAAEADAFAEANEQRMEAEREQLETAPPLPVEGYRMEVTESESPEAPRTGAGPERWWGGVAAGVPVLALLLLWWLRRR